ncbi:ABC transporter permease [Micromonospora sp. DR5-3]|uniref:ABC transporter permease n=1 Tax=unclassified Micromonospora TaxID=2617518 RepID=UPI0011D71F59|nr:MULTISPECIES: ABC transporter permease [unclassified Micromonospora]MCW3814430.1 ABC transporter permease [Micromonospora sp. DR5-3]TYC19264.1 ABC transporter permease [Micromonospora sp. MP36]
MLSYLIRRVAWLIGSLFVAGSAVFFLLRVLPGDPAVTLLAVGSSPDQIDAIRHQLGTDRPVLAQYGHWLGDLATGNLGDSLFTQLPVLDQIAGRLPVTVPLALSAFVLSIIVAVPIGVFAAVRRRGLLGVAVSTLAQLGIALPIFWVGIMVVWLVAVQWRALPPGGFPRTGWQDPGAAIQSLVLPVATLTIAQGSVLVRYVRSATLDVLSQEYVRTARSLGYSLPRALWRHGPRNGAATVVQILGILLASSLLGTVVIESVFALPGLGSLLLASVKARDLPIVQGTVFLMTATVLVVGLVVDVVQRLVDPRLRGSA